MSKPPASVRFDRVSKRYGDVTAVDDISFTVEPGKFLTLLGPSGCGKTTTLRMIAGLEMATSGRIFIGEDDVTKLAASQRDVTMVFQSYALFPHMNVRDNVMYGLSIAGHDKAAATAKAEEGLARVGLAGYGDRLPAALSGGQQQRVAVARALVLEPSVLLFDEPLSNLDAKLRRRMREDIRLLQQDLRVTAIYVTHDQEEALSVSDEIIVMDKAQIVQQGKPRDLYHRPRSLFVATFIGDANVLDGHFDGEAVKVACLRVAATSDREPGPCQIAVRPRAIQIADSSDDRLEGRITSAVYIGTHMEYRIDTDVGELFVVDRDTSTERRVGDIVGLQFEARGVNVIP